MISPGISILTLADLDAIKAKEYARGVERGKFEAHTPEASGTAREAPNQASDIVSASPTPPHPEGRAVSELCVIADILQHWINFDLEQRNKDGLPTDADTYIISPPHWPSHGQLANWIAELRRTRPSRGEAVPDDIRRLVIAARKVAFEDTDKEHLRELDMASEAFADRIPWENEDE